MHSLMKQLIDDHKHLLLLMDYLEKEISAYEPYNDSMPDLSIILDILDYIQIYPEKWHHPIEERLFAVLLAKPINSKDAIATVRLQHTELEQRTQELVKQFNAIANDQVVSIEHLLFSTKQYLQYQREHIDVENKHVFPLMMKCINDAEMDEITEELITLDDPLFGANIKNSYKLLYEEVVQMANNSDDSFQSFDAIL